MYRILKAKYVLTLTFLEAKLGPILVLHGEVSGNQSLSLDDLFVDVLVMALLLLCGRNPGFQILMIHMFLLHHLLGRRICVFVIFLFME